MTAPEEERLDNLTSAIADLLRRQDEVEKRLRRLEEMLAPPARAETPRPIISEQRSQTPVTAPSRSEAVAQVSDDSRAGFETQVGLTILNRVGVITLVLGVGFFFKWAVDNNWIGPRGRVILGLIAAFVALGLADWLWRKGQQVFAQGVTGCGIAIFFLSIYSAFGFYHLIPQAFAFLCLFGATALGVTLSLRYDSPAIAALGLFGGYVTPLLLSTGEDHPWFLLSYVLLLDVGAVLLSVKRRWRGLELLSFLATFILYTAWLVSKFPFDRERLAGTLAVFAYLVLYTRASVRELFVLGQFLAALALVDLWSHSVTGFFALVLILTVAGLGYAELRNYSTSVGVAFASFWSAFGAWESLKAVGPGPVASFTGITLGFLLFLAFSVWRLKFAAQRANLNDLWIFSLNAAVYYAVAYGLLNTSYRHSLGLLAVMVAGLYIACATYLHSGVESELEINERSVVLSFAVAICFLALAVPIQFTGFTITIVWSLEAAALAWMAVRFRNRGAQWISLGLFAFTFCRLLAIDAWRFNDAKSYLLLWNSRMLAFGVAASSLLVASRWSYEISRRTAVAEYLAGHVALLFGLTLEVLGAAQRSVAPQNLLSVDTFAVSILFAIYAVMLVSIGVGTRSAVNRIAGLALIGIVILKLYLFDVWQLQRVYRISAFVALGVLLLGTSFLYSHWRRLVERWWKDDEARS